MTTVEIWMNMKGKKECARRMVWKGGVEAF